jgi:ubiquinone/menaquinone biosynthesis C-methylase UbiE
MSVVGRLRDAVRGVRSVPPRQAAASALDGRSDYKGTWTALSRTHADAAMWVAGYTDEDELERTGTHTVEVLQQLVGVKPEDRVLEIGCGIGRVGKVLAPQCAEWVGCDVSPNMLEAASFRLRDLDNVRFVELAEVGLGEFEDAAFDVVYCTVVFMHLFEWDRFTYVREAHRVLRPGGRCLVDNVDITSSHGRKFFAESAAFALDERPAQIGMVSSGDELRCYGEWAGFDEVTIHRWDDAWVGMVGVKAAG